MGIIEEKDRKIINIISKDYDKVEYDLVEGYKATVKSGDLVKSGQAIAVAPEQKAMRSDLTGKVTVSKNKIIILATERLSASYPIGLRVNLKVADGDEVVIGQDLTEGHLNLTQGLKLKGEIATQKYIIRGIQEIYASQGQTINDKHIETIVRCMFSKVKIMDGGDTDYIGGQVIDRLELDNENAQIKEKKGNLATYEKQILGITRIALKTKSFLSAASFQETTAILIEAATKGAVDRLQGLKENVIIGKLIPAGTAIAGKQIKV